MALLGTLQLELSAPTDRLSSDLDRAQQIVDAQSVAMRRRIEKIQAPIAMRVDDRALTELNKHLTSKQEHYQRVQADFAKPLKVNVSYKEINEFDRQLTHVSRDRKISLGAGVLPSTLQGVKNSIGRLVFSPITIPIRIAQNAVKGIFNGILSGIGFEIGKTILGATEAGLKKSYGFDLKDTVTQKVTDFTSSPKHSKVAEEFNKVRTKVGNSAAQIRYRVGDAVVAGIDANDNKSQETSNAADKLNLARKELLKDNKIQQEVGNIGRDLAVGSRRMANAVFGGDNNPNFITNAIDKSMQAATVRSTNDRTIPLVKARAAEILAGKKDFNNAKLVTDQTEELIISMGGYAAANGVSGKRIAKDVKDRAPDTTQSIWVANKDSDIAKHTGEKPFETGMAILKSVAKPHIRGYSKDEVEMVAQAVAAREINPNVKIKFFAESGGGLIANRAAGTFAQMGYDNFDHMGVGTPDLIGSTVKNNNIVSPDEPLGKATHKVLQRIGVARPNRRQNVLGVKDHPYESYSDPNIAEVMNFIKGAPKPFDRQEINDYKKEGKRVAQLDPKEMKSDDLRFYKHELFQDWQRIRRQVLTSTGGLHKELKAIADNFETAYLNAEPDTGKIVAIRTKLNGFRKAHTELNANRGVASGVKADEIKAELLEMEDSIADAMEGTVGTERVKYQRLAREVKLQVAQFSNPKLGRKHLAPKPAKPDPNAIADPWGESNSNPTTQQQPFQPEIPDIADPWADNTKPRTRSNRTNREVRTPFVNNTPPSKSNDFVNLEPAIKQFHISVIRFETAVNKFGQNNGGQGGDATIKPKPPAPPTSLVAKDVETVQIGLERGVRNSQVTRAASPLAFMRESKFAPNPSVLTNKSFVPNTPVDYITTPSTLESTKETASLIYNSLDRQKLAIEQAIVKGQVAIARNLNNKLDKEVKDAQSFVQRFSQADAIDTKSADHLKSTVKGNITQKANFVERAGRMIDMIDNDVDPKDIKQAINTPAVLKAFAIKGLLARRKENENNSRPGGNLEGGFMNLGGRIPMLDFMDTPVESFRNTVNKTKGFFSRTKNTTAPTPNIPLEDPTEGLNPNKFDAIGTAVNFLRNSFGQLGGAIKSLVVGFAGFFILQKVGEMLLSAGVSAITTASRYENLAVRIISASDSVQSGKNLYDSTTRTADKLGVTRLSALETASNISGTTFGTELQGKPSERITEQIIKLGQLRGLSPQQSSALTSSITEMLGSDRVDARRINELQQSAGIADVRAIGARSMGYTPEQFNTIQQSGVGLDPKTFVSSFLRQGINDSQLSQAAVRDSNEFKQNKLAAGIQQGESDFTKPFNTVYKTGIDLLTNAITLLNENAATVGKVINGVLITSLLYAARAFGIFAIEAKLFQGLMQNISNMTLAGSGGLALSVARMGALAAGLYLIGDGIEYISKKFTNAYADIGTQAEALAAITSKISGKGKVDDSTLPDRDSDIKPSSKASISERIANFLQGGTSYVANAMNATHYDNPLYNNPVAGLVRTVTGTPTYTAANNSRPEDNQFGNDYEKNSENRRVEMAKATESIAKSAKFVIEQAASVKDRLARKDIELSGLSTEKSGLFAGGEADAGKATNLTKRFNKAYSERDALRAELDDATQSAQAAVDLSRNNKKRLEKDFSEKTITKEDYKTLSNQNAIDIKKAEDAQNKLNDAIKSGLTDLLPWTRELSKISAKFEDINVDAANAANKVKIGRTNDEISGKRTRGQTEYTSASDKSQFLEIKNKEIGRTIKELEFTLTSRDPNAIKNVQKSYGVNSNTSSAQLKLLADTAVSPQDKQVLAQMGVIRDKKNETLTNATQINDVRGEAFRKLYDENKQAQLYYVSLAQQLDPVANAFANASAKVVKSKDVFLAKLNNFGSGLFDIYTTAYLGLLDAGKDKLEQQAKLASEKKAAIDAYENRTLAAEGAEYNRFTPKAKLNGGMRTGVGSTTQQSQPASSQPSSRNNIVPLQRNSGQGVAGAYRGVGNPQNHVDAAEAASRALLNQQLKKAELNNKVAEATSGSESRKIRLMQDLEEKTILIGQVAAKKVRDRGLEALDPNAEIGLKGKQNRARIEQSNSLADQKDIKTNDVRQLANSLSNAKANVLELQANKNRTPEQDKVLKQILTDMPRNEGILKSAQTNLAGFDKLAASKKASLVVEQKYQQGVADETNRLDQQTRVVEKLKTELTGLNQQLAKQPFNMEGKAKARSQATEIGTQEADMALVRAKRKITEDGRTNENFGAAAQAKALAAANASRDRSIKNIKEKQVQDSLKDQQDYDAEVRGIDIAQSGLNVNKMAMNVRQYQQEDKINAPFASDNAIAAELQQKLGEFERAKKERDDRYEKTKIRYTSSPEFLEKAKNQYDQENNVANTGLAVDRAESNRQINANAIGRRGYRFGQQIKLYDTETAFKSAEMEGIKNRGGDTRDMEFDLAVRAKQKETASKLVDLQAQRDALIGTATETIKAREEIDKLIVLTKELAVIDITNISDKFDRFNGILGKVQSTTLEVFSAWQTTGKFDWRKILLSGLDEALKQINAKLMGDLFKPLYRQSEKTATPDTKSLIVQGAESAANMLGTGGGIKNGAPGLLNSDGSINELNSSSTNRSFTPSATQPQIANPIDQSLRSIVNNGLVQLALPGGGSMMMSEQDAISKGFINLDGTPTNAPKPSKTFAPNPNDTPNESSKTFNFGQLEGSTDIVDLDEIKLKLERERERERQRELERELIIIPPPPVDEYDGYGIPPAGYNRRLPKPPKKLSSAGITGGGGGIAGSLIGMVLPSLLSIIGLKDGDVVKPDPMFRTLRDGDDPIAKALRKEGNDAILAALTPGERILSLKQTSIYQTMFPQGIENHASGGVAGGATPVELNIDPNKKNGGGDNNFHFDIDNSSRGADGQLQSRQLIDGLRSVVVQELIRQKRNGSGLIA